MRGEQKVVFDIRFWSTLSGDVYVDVCPGDLIRRTPNIVQWSKTFSATCPLLGENLRKNLHKENLPRERRVE